MRSLRLGGAAQPRGRGGQPVQRVCQVRVAAAQARRGVSARAYVAKTYVATACCAPVHQRRVDRLRRRVVIPVASKQHLRRRDSVRHSVQATGALSRRSASSAGASGEQNRQGRGAYGAHWVRRKRSAGGWRVAAQQRTRGSNPQRTATWNTFSASGTDGGPPLFTSRAPARRSHVSTSRQRCAAWQRHAASAKGFALSRAVAAGGRTQGGEEARRVAHSALRLRLGRVDQDRNKLRPAERQRRTRRAPPARQRRGTNARSACRRYGSADAVAAALLRRQRREARAVRSANSRVSAMKNTRTPADAAPIPTPAPPTAA